MKILHLTLKPKVPKDKILEQFAKGAPVFASIKGLTWKIWIENKEDGTVGGLYYFKDDAAFEEYKKSDMYKGTSAVPLWGASYMHMHALMHVGAALPPKRSIGIACINRAALSACVRASARACFSCTSSRAHQHSNSYSRSSLLLNHGS